MKTSNQIVCVLRSVNGIQQWVAAAGRHDLVKDETTMVGHFDSFEVRTGPSGSHVITCYEPQASANPSSAGTYKTCVLRLVGGQHEYVDADGRVDLVAGETIFSGKAVHSTVRTGPSRSHTVTVWNFVGATQRSIVPQNDETGRYALAELLQTDPRRLVIDGSTFGAVDLSSLIGNPTNFVGVAAQ